MSSLKYWVWLSELPGLRKQTRLALLERFGSPENVYYADPEELALTEGMTKEQADSLQNKGLRRAEDILQSCREKGYRIMTMQDADYPSRLRNIYDPPCLLYLRGRLPIIDEEVAIAVVGTRSCTPYGIHCAEKLSGQMASAGALIVTGLARGVDSAAAWGALKSGGAVIGVLGGGLDVVYPPENGRLYDDVAAQGALVSEYPPGTETKGRHFPVRNRIISGLSVATLVVEAGISSGALITAGTALEQSREIYAVPGPIDAPASIGCNRLIQQGAGLASDGWDVLRDYVEAFPGKLHPETVRREPEHVLGYRSREERRQPPKEANALLSREGLTDDQIHILECLPADTPMLTDDLIEATGIPVRRVLSALTMLEIDGSVAQHPGKRYTRLVELTK